MGTLTASDGRVVVVCSPDFSSAILGPSVDVGSKSEDGGNDKGSELHGCGGWVVWFRLR